MDTYETEQLLLDIASTNYRVGSHVPSCKHCQCSLLGVFKYNYNDEKHSHDCIVFRARVLLDHVWHSFVEEQRQDHEEHQYQKQRKREDARFERKLEEMRAEREKQRTECPTCGKKVFKKSLAEHQATSVKCREKATGIKCIKSTVGYKGPVCLNCFKPMPDAHPNKKFCSNKGAGNCKDRYHNSTNEERKERAKLFSNHYEGSVELPDGGYMFRNETLYEFTDPEGNTSLDTLDPDIDENKDPSS